MIIFIFQGTKQYLDVPIPGSSVIHKWLTPSKIGTDDKAISDKNDDDKDGEK